MQGNELYFYSKQNDRDHKFMHCLSGTYLKEVSNTFDLADSRDEKNGMQYYLLKIIIPPNKSRIIYFDSQDDRLQWEERLMTAMGYSNVFDFYDLESTLGKG
jgi:hypothetical protein